MYSGKAARHEIRVFVDVDGLMADMVKEMLASQSDMQLVPDLRHTAGPAAVDGRTDVDIVVTRLESDSVRWRYRDVFFSEKGLPLIAISNSGETVEVFDRWTVRQVGLDQLVGAIRDVAKRRADHGSTGTE